MMKLRTYNPEDWDAIAVIHDRARLDELRASVGIAAFLSLAATAENEGLFEGEVWVACEDETVVGFIAFADDEVTWLYVSPGHYRQGVGRSLLRHAIARCGKIVSTSVLSGNAAALQLYLSEGFRIIETKTGKLNGNESFPATGHILELDKQYPNGTEISLFCTELAPNPPIHSPQGIQERGALKVRSPQNWGLAGVLTCYFSDIQSPAT